MNYEFIVEIYITYIYPFLIPIISALLSIGFIWIRNKLGVSEAALVNTLKHLANLNDKDMGIDLIGKLQDVVTTKLDAVCENENIILEYLDIAFKNSNLDETVKEQLETLKNKVKFGDTYNEMLKLKQELVNTQEELTTIKNNIAAPIKQIVENVKEVKKVRS